MTLPEVVYGSMGSKCKQMRKRKGEEDSLSSLISLGKSSLLVVSLTYQYSYPTTLMLEVIKLRF